MTAPCDGCCRVHRGPRCQPAEQRSVPMTVTFPAHVARELRERVPWGERSGFVARAVDAALERRCSSCAAPLDALGNCTGCCDPADWEGDR